MAERDLMKGRLAAALATPSSKTGLAPTKMEPTPDKLPSKELLEQRHSFPCRYTFKVIGTADEGFEARIKECVQRELRTNTEPRSSVRETKGGRHQSVTVEPTCPDADAVLRLYTELRKVEGVMFLF